MASVISRASSRSSTPGTVTPEQSPLPVLNDDAQGVHRSRASACPLQTCHPTARQRAGLLTCDFPRVSSQPIPDQNL